MTYLLLHADALASVATDRPLVPAAEVAAVRDAAALLAEAHRLRQSAEQEHAEARAAQQQLGYDDGYRRGRAAAQAEQSQALVEIETHASEREQTRRDQIAQLAIEVVRRIVGELDAGEVVAGLAERATAGVTGDTATVVRVAPQHVDATRARLTGRPVAVEGDDGMDPQDCIIETAVGRTHAGLDTQLGALERAWQVT